MSVFIVYVQILRSVQSGAMDILNTKYFHSCSFQENNTLHSSDSDDTSSVKQLVGSISGNKNFENQGFQTGGEEINANAGQLQLA